MRNRERGVIEIALGEVGAKLVEHLCESEVLSGKPARQGAGAEMQRLRDPADPRLAMGEERQDGVLDGRAQRTLSAATTIEGVFPKADKRLVEVRIGAHHRQVGRSAHKGHLVMARAELDRLAKELLERRGGRAAGMGEPDPDRAKVSVRQLAEDADQSL